MNNIRSFLLVLLLACPLFAVAQWQWVDKDGRKVYSDRAPPSDVPAKNVLQQPGGGTLSSYSSDAPAPAASSPGAPSASDSSKKAADDGDEARRKAMAQNCERAKGSLLVLRSGIRLKAANAKGEVDYITDAERTGEIDRLQAIIAADCK